MSRWLTGSCWGSGGGTELRFRLPKAALVAGASLSVLVLRGDVPHRVWGSGTGERRVLRFSAWPAGSVTVLVRWWQRPGALAVAWRTLEVGNDEVRDLGTLRPTSDTTRLTHRLRVLGARRNQARAALRRPRKLSLKIQVSEPGGLRILLIAVRIQAGGSLRVRGARAEELRLGQGLLPEHLADGWALGPCRSIERRAAGRFTWIDQVARTRLVAVRVTGVPGETEAVAVWLRSAASESPWRLPRVAITERQSEGTWIGALPLLAGPWEVLAQARDAHGKPAGAAALLRIEIPEGRAPSPSRLTLPLQPSAALIVVLGTGRVAPGEALIARPEGWTVDLALGQPEGNQGLRLEGLVPAANCALTLRGRTRIVRAPQAGGLRYVDW